MVRLQDAFGLVTPLLSLSGVMASGVPPQHDKRDTCAGNTADTRTEWCDYTVATDYSEITPDTGVTREYYFNLEDGEIAPDGVTRYAMTINGTIPGPTIFADWGDTVIVHVTNSLTTSTNGTSIHFQGVRQLNTNQNDGVASVTQCPTPPGSTETYTWRATQYGSSWYHSHFSLQAWEGVFGGIKINGPATANYDTDLGLLLLSDWSHQTVDELWDTAQTNATVFLDTGLINGTNVWGEDGDASQTGYRYNVSLTEGQSYRIGLVNTALDTHFKFSIDNHTLTVMTTDFVPIEPFSTDVLNIGIAQRYDVIVTANQAAIADSFWLRAIPQSACSSNNNPDNILGIVYYGDSTTLPTTTGYSNDNQCDDMPASDLVPHVSKTVGSVFYNELEDVTVGQNTDNYFRWYLNSTTLQLDWETPTLLQIYDNTTEFPTSNAVIQGPSSNETVLLVITTTFAVPHPIHLHGHDFYVVAQGTGDYDSSVTLNTDNPPRRDTAMLPASGYLALAFVTDNPGAWLLHCHIGWHTSEGLALQFVESQSDITIDYDTLDSTCTAWDAHQSSVGLEEIDSGI